MSRYSLNSRGELTATAWKGTNMVARIVRKLNLCVRVISCCSIICEEGQPKLFRRVPRPFHTIARIFRASLCTLSMSAFNNRHILVTPLDQPGFWETLHGDGKSLIFSTRLFTNILWYSRWYIYIRHAWAAPVWGSEAFWYFWSVSSTVVINLNRSRWPAVEYRVQNM